jgi:hypothetical protein
MFFFDNFKNFIMYQRTLIALFIFVTGIAYVNAQVIVGDEVPKAMPQNLGASNKPDKIKFLHLSYFSPSLTPAFQYNTGPFKTGSGTTYGAMFETGAFRFFGSNFIGDMGNLGLYSSFGLGAAMYDYNVPEDFTGVRLPFLFTDLKIGPNFYFEFGDESSINLYGHIGVLASYGGLLTSEDLDYIYKPVGLPIGMQTGFGLSLVLGNFILGGQYTLATNEYSYELDIPDGFFEATYPDINLNSIRAYIGFRINR